MDIIKVRMRRRKDALLIIKSMTHPQEILGIAYRKQEPVRMVFKDDQAVHQMVKQT